jgi:hypothetical protein
MSTNFVLTTPQHIRGLTPFGSSPQKSPIKTPDVVQCRNIFDLLNEDNLPADFDTESDSVPLTERKNSIVSLQPDPMALSPAASSDNFATFSPLPVRANSHNIKARYVLHSPSPSTQPSIVQPSPMHTTSDTRPTFRRREPSRELTEQEKAEKLAFTKACYYVEKDSISGDYGMCSKKGCTFAHTMQELRIPKCRFGENCKHGKSCYYMHSAETIQQYFRRIGKPVPNLPTGVEKTQESTESPIPSKQFSSSSPSKPIAILPALKEEPEASFGSRTSSSPQEKVHEEPDTATHSCTESHTSVEPSAENTSTIHVPIQFLEQVLDMIQNKKYANVNIKVG